MPCSGVGPTGTWSVGADDDGDAADVPGVVDCGTGLDDVACGGGGDACVSPAALLQAPTLASSTAAVSSTKRPRLVVTGSALLIGQNRSQVGEPSPGHRDPGPADGLPQCRSACCAHLRRRHSTGGHPQRACNPHRKRSTQRPTAQPDFALLPCHPPGCGRVLGRQWCRTLARISHHVEAT
jgi:hypothetical protein